ncbi:tannase/feruloyl esterase family alpha/beta hydrolase [Chelativorans salis]|uniref:Tannase/feruloyl esterase family alpha/beta hydrolase n=1 Tax=Chelativorans salis TaxID=2978478 RepID=A0ABT2LTP9_9HYPH|nr:tannase/feruloyl esterase family alpha/beta hydrolase [Chelativorans sp. EGI FJ00035]MCT7377874.1 tannase/feruloyl esterase family alpha/beta hydrolase [Chelativorans sp. EGI FJ00035]
MKDHIRCGVALGLASALAVIAIPGIAFGACEDVSAAAPAGVTITEATRTVANDEVPIDHCLVRGVMDERTGSDGRDYALRFELRLPDEWQGRFLHQFNGGNDGKVVPAIGANTGIAGDKPALARGFAVVSSDAGHDGEAFPEYGLAGGNAFGHDFEARRDYGYDAVATLHPVALKLVESYYRRPADYVYGAGNSNGGRHAMVAAVRLPDAFDGLLAGYPGFNLPKSALQGPMEIRAFLSVEDKLADAFSREELDIVSDAITAACDGLDGLEDGVIFAAHACQSTFEPGTMTCADGQNTACLSAEKVAVLEKIHAGPINSAGEQLYNSWYWDAGINSKNWRLWKLESPIPPWGRMPIRAIMGAGSVAQIFTTPPTKVGGTPDELLAFLYDFDLDTQADMIYATTEEFPESAMELMTPPGADNPTLGGLEKAGVKMIVFHGVSDPIFSAKDTADWYERVISNNPNADGFLRYYEVPGMPHGQGGNAPDEFDMLGALIAWVEDGKAPSAITAQFRSDNPEIDQQNAGAERPLCPYPQHALFSGGEFACN